MRSQNWERVSWSWRKTTETDSLNPFSTFPQDNICIKPASAVQGNTWSEVRTSLSVFQCTAYHAELDRSLEKWKFRSRRFCDQEGNLTVFRRDQFLFYGWIPWLEVFSVNLRPTKASSQRPINTAATNLIISIRIMINYRSNIQRALNPAPKE